MSDRKYFVLCADNCKFESMTKEQILAAIEQAISTGKITDVDTGFVTKLKEQNANKALTFWVGTTAEYNELPEKVNNCFYILTDDTTGDDLIKLYEELSKTIEDLNALYGELKEEVHTTRLTVEYCQNIKTGKAELHTDNGQWAGFLDFVETDNFVNVYGKYTFNNPYNSETGIVKLQLTGDVSKPPAEMGFTVPVLFSGDGYPANYGISYACAPITFDDNGNLNLFISDPTGLDAVTFYINVSYPIVGLG